MKKLLKIVTVVVGLAAAVSFIVFRFRNPELTETQLVLEGWPKLAALVVAFVAYHILDYKE